MECKHLYQDFLLALQGEVTSSAASILLFHIDEKRKNCWSKAVYNIDFMHSSCLAWNQINNLTGRTRYTCDLCPITTNFIALQLVKNGVYKTMDHESTKL